MFFAMFTVFSLLIALFIYLLSGRVLRGFGIKVTAPLWRIARAVFAILLGIFCLAYKTGMIIALYLFAVFVAYYLAAVVIRLIFKNRKKGSGYRFLVGCYRYCIPQLLTLAVILGYGHYSMNNLVETRYTLYSEKLTKEYSLILITDMHYGTVQSPEVIKSKVGELSRLNADALLIGGDIVEEGTSKEAMQEVFALLGDVKTRYGGYYVYGNHDRQRYTPTPAYTEEELANTIRDNGITLLQDKAVMLGQELCLIGREDAGFGRSSGRAPTAELLTGLPQECYKIVLDHQPTAFTENAEAGVELQLSGHTHGGQIFPLGFCGELFGIINSYGSYNEGGLTAIVSSGAAGWGFSLRTENPCEYVVVELKPMQAKVD